MASPSQSFLARQSVLGDNHHSNLGNISLSLLKVRNNEDVRDGFNLPVSQIPDTVP
jgi:hypothetical protein